MTARRGVLGMIASGAAALLGGCGLLGGSSYRFRLTVEVETPQGLRNGSSVYEVKAWNEPGMDPSGKVRKWTVRGEAVAVDLPGGRKLFALLKTGAHFEDMAGLSMATLYPGFAAEGYDVVCVARELARDNFSSPVEVAPRDYPMLVRFRDIANPASVEQVEPGDLVTAFGGGVRLRGIKVELTDEPVTTGIEGRLEWLARVGRERSSLRTDVPKYVDETEDIQLVSPHDFSTELGK